MNLLDGSKDSFHVATGPSAGGMDIQMPNTVLQALGIEDFDVTSGDFDISAIDDALDKVSSARSSMGASSNRLDSVMAYNANASYNLTASRSKLEDQDYAKGVSELKKNQLLETFQKMMQRKRVENENGRVLQLFRA